MKEVVKVLNENVMQQSYNFCHDVPRLDTMEGLIKFYQPILDQVYDIDLNNI